MFFPAGDERFVRALQYSLATDVDPASRCHLPVHHQPLGAELVKMVPGGPFRYEVAVGDEYAGRFWVGSDDAHGLPRLDKKGMVLIQLQQRGEYFFQGRSVSSRLPDTSVHHQ